MKTNKAMKTKVLVIEDERDHFNRIKSWLENFDYIVLPEKFDDMGKALDKRIGSGIYAFVQMILEKHSRDIGLILCDIRFGNDSRKGYKIVKHIREFKDLSPFYWTSMVPIIGMTNYADIYTTEDGIVAAGADYVFRKNIIFNDLKESSNKNNKEANTLRTIIDIQVEKFQKNLKILYPKGLEDRIIRFKDNRKNKKTAFIMTSFRHKNFAVEVRKVLALYDIIGFIADAPGGMNYGKIWENIEIFMHGCDFGICVYADDSKMDIEDKKKKKRDKINPNVSIEVGYMLGLQKNVCFLKHESLPTLPSDFGGEIYSSFKDEESLRHSLITWLTNRQIIDI